MLRRTPILLVSILLALSGGLLVPLTAAALPPKPRVLISAGNREVVEGDVIKVVAKVPAARTAKRVTLERLKMPVYEFLGSPTWESVKTLAVRGRSKIVFRATAQQADLEKFRVRVQYSDTARVVVSKPVTVVVWSWVRLRSFSPYQETSGLQFGEVSIAGRRYQAWSAASWYPARSWESRHTPGRHCKAFRGVAGLTDSSADGSTASIQLLADDQPTWSSPTLTPGTLVPFEIALKLPYRFALLATNTSADAVKAFPAIGDPEFLCTGL